MQMVDRMDQGAIPQQVVAQSYEALWKLVSKALYRTHVEGKLKVWTFTVAITCCHTTIAGQHACKRRESPQVRSIDHMSCTLAQGQDMQQRTLLDWFRMPLQAEIIQDPASFVELDPEMAYTLLDLKRAVSRATLHSGFPDPLYPFRHF